MPGGVSEDFINTGALKTSNDCVMSPETGTGRYQLVRTLLALGILKMLKNQRPDCGRRQGCGIWRA